MLDSPDDLVPAICVAWYGLWQLQHMIFIALRAFPAINKRHEQPFPAPPEGWAPQLGRFTTGIGYVDFANTFVAMVFVAGYFADATWAWWMGTVTVTIAVYASLICAIGWVAIRAWRRATWRTYFFLLYVPFVPVYVLFALSGVYAFQGKLL